MKITYDELPECAKDYYKKLNKTRTTMLFISWGLCGLFLLFLFSKGDFMHKLSISFTMVYLWSAFPLGASHLNFFFRKMTGSANLIGKLIGFFVYLAILAFGEFYFFFILLIDTVLFVLKKPLVYPFEHKSIVQLPKIQEQIYADILNNMSMEAEKEDIKEKIMSLKSMYDEKLITEEEYNRKKQELIERM